MARLRYIMEIFPNLGNYVGKFLPVHKLGVALESFVLVLDFLFVRYVGGSVDYLQNFIPLLAFLLYF